MQIIFSTKRQFLQWSLITLAFLSSACKDSDFQKPKYPAHKKPTLYTTISSDGKLVATLDHIGSETPRLRINWVDKNEPWQELPAPMYADSIRFGLSGYSILLTHRIPGEPLLSQLTRWDISNLKKESEALYTGPNLAFAIELEGGKVLVRNCTPYDWKPQSCGTAWLLVSSDGSTEQVSPKHKSLSYSQPNITSNGFYWFDQFTKTEGQPDLRAVLAFSRPDKPPLDIDISMFDRNTVNINCASQSPRCLHRFEFGKNPVNARFIYDIEVFLGKERCRPEGLRGWSDGQSLSPDGRSAVMSLAQEYDSPRHVVVIHFDPGQCEPKSIEHLKF